tara:strand:+ start:74647 stop:75684 length:1038 start_codon:yes stop_codon:yes gene_type:complete
MADMTEIVAVDIGGTNARFARATCGADGTPKLGTIFKYRVADYPSFESCWAAFARDDGGRLPASACIGIASAINPDIIRLTNSGWIIRPQGLAAALGIEHVSLVNDFEAIGHAVTRLSATEMELLFGPDHPFPENGAVTVLGPGTGLGVSLIAYSGGIPQVIATEGGHIDFAPLDNTEATLLASLRAEHLRVSVERLASGPGLNAIYRGLAEMNRAEVALLNDADLWAAALSGENALARAALERFCMIYGSVAGDIALVHGPSAVVLVGSLTRRLQPLLRQSGFHSRFTAKGRFEGLMRQIPVRLAIHDEIGLFGAAAAYYRLNSAMVQLHSGRSNSHQSGQRQS